MNPVVTIETAEGVIKVELYLRLHRIPCAIFCPW